MESELSRPWRKRRRRRVGRGGVGGSRLLLERHYQTVKVTEDSRGGHVDVDSKAQRCAAESIGKSLRSTFITRISPASMQGVNLNVFQRQHALTSAAAAMAAPGLTWSAL